MREKPETGTPQVVEAQVPGISIAAGLPFRLDAEELADFAADEHSSDILKERFYRASLKNLLSQSDNEDVAIGHTEGATRSEKNDIAHTLPHQVYFFISTLCTAICFIYSLHIRHKLKWTERCFCTSLFVHFILSMNI